MTDTLRKGIIKPVKRVVVKVGSGVLTGKGGLNLPIIDDLTADICELGRRGIEVILVSSGAIASGLKKVGFSKRPESVSQQQATAAVGQISLMTAYEKTFASHDRKVAQILITRDDLTHRQRYLNARNTLFTLLSWNIVPIINENDTVVADEIKFGDNDNLSAMVTNLTESRLLVNLTNLDGLFDKDPRTHKDAKLIRIVHKADRKVARYAGSIPGFLGRGGMASKVRAAQTVALAGVPTIIANGLRPGILKTIFSGKEEGTLFMPREVPLSCRKHWIVFTKSPKGEIIIDRGAERAIIEHGKSLLPPGILDVKGRFGMGNSVLLVNERGEEIAVGMVNYHSGDIKKIMGANTNDIEQRLGFKHDDEVVHRDNLVLTTQLQEGEDICRLRT
ncbi:MAG: glutamate 5-kinase [Desulfatiglans sp.]|nr:glutamate 5-kinase [Thermodesulfobacteriota bacterium]MEE4353493.1 glutamate 5-kinase [Desulfatiglans sp.]